MDDERSARQVELWYSGHELAVLLHKEAELVHLRLEAAPPTVLPRFVRAEGARQILVRQLGHNRAEDERVVNVVWDRVDRTQSLLFRVGCLRHTCVVEPDIAILDVLSHLLLSDWIEVQEPVRFLVVEGLPLFLCREQRFDHSLCYLVEKCLCDLELFTLGIWMHERSPLVRQEEDAPHVGSPLEDLLFLDHLLIRQHLIELHERLHLHHHHWEAAPKLK